MKHVLRRRPSPSMVVAITALVVALSGTAVAAGSLIGGDRLIKKHSLSGNRLRNHTLTGQQVNLSKLGKVARAANADSAVRAGSASNASRLGGEPPSAYLPASVLRRTGNVILNSGQTGVVLFQNGPLSTTADCTTSGGTISATLKSNSTVDNWLFNGAAKPAGSQQNAIASSPSSAESGDFALIEQVAPAGQTLRGEGTLAVNYPNPGQCTFNADAVG